MAEPQPIPVPVQQTLPFEVRVIRWWGSVAVWLQASSVISEGWLPVLLLVDPETLGFSPRVAAIAMLVIKLINVTVQITQRNRSVNVVGSKSEVAMAAAAPAPEVVPTPTTQP